MSVRIVADLSDSKTSARVNKILGNLLKVIPGEHLVGLESIIIKDDIKDKRIKGRIAGMYQPGYKNKKPFIVINYGTLFSDVPGIIRIIPFYFKLTLASTLYHEIGHHYHHQLKHGVKKSHMEEFVREYRKKMLAKAFWGWRYLLRPLTLLKVFTKK